MKEVENNIPTHMEEEEKQIYSRARKRVSFKIHLTIYILIVIFFWLLWYFLFKGREDTTFFKFTLAVTLFWFVFILSHYLIVYKLNTSLLEKEVKRLKKQNEKLKTQYEELNKNDNL